MTHLISPVVLVSNDENFLPYALASSRGFFGRYVIYDVGSTDRTRDIIQWFCDTTPGVSFFVRAMPMLPPSVQGAFRNSMIAESLSAYYFILDGDELYTSDGYEAIIRGAEVMQQDVQKLYGIVRRVEVGGDLVSAYGLHSRIPHHRVYQRRAIWTGSHPGEAPYFRQEPRVEQWIEGSTCYHFHNAERSSRDAEVPKRLERRARLTYRPGESEPLDLLRVLPILGQQIENFPLNSRLATLQSG